MKIKKLISKALIVFAGIILVTLVAARCYFRLPVQKYYEASEKAFKIPDCNAGFVAQGISYDVDSSSFFVTGYKTDGSASPIYVVNKNNGSFKSVSMLTRNGDPFVCHAGGLSVTDNYVYVAGGSDGCVYVYDRKEILSASNDDTVTCLGRFETKLGDGTDIDVAFTTVHDGKLYVGEFYRDPNYPTEKSHKITTRSGDYNQALAVAYEFSDDQGALFGLSQNPTSAYSLPDLVQGMCFHNGKIFLSTSYGISFSNILAYDEKSLEQHGEIAGIPLYELDSSALSYSMKLPPMSEEIEFIPGEDKMYVMCESASNKYIFGKLTGGQWCYATEWNW